GTVLGVQATGEYLAGTPITNTLINLTNEVQAVTYHFKARIRDDRPGHVGNFCDQGGDTTITVYVNPTPRLTVAIPDTIVCDSSTINITVNDGNGAVAGGTTKVYQLTTTDAGGTVLGVQATGEYIAGTPITNTLINLTNEVQAVTYHFKARIRDDRPGHVGNFCDQGGDTTITVYVNPTPRFTVTVDDTVICDLSNVVLDVTDLLGNVLGGKVYDLTTTYTAGAVTGVSPNGEYPIALDVVNTLINNTDVFQTITYHFRYRLTDTRNGGIPFCDHGIDTAITIYLEPTAKIVASVDIDTICNDGTVNITWTTPTVPTVDIVFNVSVVNPYPEVTLYAGAIGLPKGAMITDAPNNSGDTARLVMYVFSPVLLDNGLNQKCPGINDTIRVWVNPTPRVIPVNDATRICSDDFTSILLTSPSVMTKGQILFDYTITKTVPEGSLNGNELGATGILPGHRIEFSYFNDTDTIQSVRYHVLPRVTELVCSNGLVVPVEVKVHPLPILDIVVTNPVTCTGGSDAALMAVLSKGADPYQTYWTGPDNWEAYNLIEATNLYEGMYEVFVTDSLGCTNMRDIVIFRTMENIRFSGLLKAPNYTYHSTCNGSNDAEIDLWVTEGTSYPYLYWVTNAQGDTLYSGSLSGNRNLSDTTTFRRFSGLSARQYILIFQDINGCMSYRSVFITQPQPIKINLDARTYEGGFNITCRGRSDGSAWVVSSTGGNVGAHTYEWSTSRLFLSGTVTPGPVIDNIPAGTYYVKATDSMGCIKIDSITLIEPEGIELLNSVLSFSADSAFNISCNGGSNGSIALDFGGGSGTYNYNWVNYPAGANIIAGAKDQSGLIAGIYDLLVVDGNGCDRPYSFELTQPDTLKIIPTASTTFDNAFNINCNGGTGTIDLNVTGGSIGNYTYNWSTQNGSGISQGVRDQVGLTQGMYLVEVVDSNGCRTEEYITLTEPEPLTSASVPTHITCESPGFDNGSIELTVAGGSGTYSYLWSNGATTKDISGLTAGEYSVIITDTYMCNAFDTAIVELPPPLVISVASSDHNGFDVSCFGRSDGWIEITPQSGEEPFFYQWTGPGGFTSTDKRVTNLIAGTYSVTVTDNNMCVTTEVIEVSQPGKLDINVDLSQSYDGMYNINCYGSSTGYIILEAVNGVGDLQWLWSDGATGDSRNGLPAGDYRVILIDENNCVVDSLITLTHPDSITITFEVSQPMCLDNPDGSIIVNVDGGVPVYSYLWNDNTTTRDRLDALPGFYRLRVTDMNGCVAVDSVKLEAEKEVCLDIPNAFSPNGDNINDVWNMGMVFLYPQMEVTIFNRWSEPVWRSERGYPVPWNGRSNGRALPMDSYHYIINLNNGRKPIIGNVTIVR
ncbi:MAG: gliding motility-associated C-terminal domain-containing protein, partial [Bacteroidales bacterium]|nr:gliding motility-associated C-terminal domain-containing protein [Bacteroidales bacterium]